MKRIHFLFYLTILFLSMLTCFQFYSCSSNDKKNEKNVAEVKIDSLEIIREQIYGLWSKDSGNALSNTGYYFHPDGTIDFVSSESTGSWELLSPDSLKIVYSYLNEEFKSLFKIDSIVEGRMTISDEDGNYLFRKVPFGMNEEGVVAQGFSGDLEFFKEKEYFFDMPPAKKVKLQLNSKDTTIVFTVFDDKKELITIPTRSWTAIMVRSGKYKVRVFSTNHKNAGEFDLKVILY